MPILIPLLWIIGLLSLGLVGGGLYLIYAWYTEMVVGSSYLLGGVAMLLLAATGRPILLFFLGRRGNDEPRATREGRIERIRAADGTELHVELYGPEDGQSIVMTHGWGLNSIVWYYAKRQLAEHFRLIVWDLPGLGESAEPPDKDYDLEKMAQYLEAVLSVTGNKPVLLLGHSIGGMITLTFCRLFPEHLEHKIVGVLLVHTTYTNPVKTTFLKRLLRTLQKPLLVPLMYLTIWLSPIVRLMNWLSYYNGSLHLLTAFMGFGGCQTRGQLDFAAYFTPIASPAVLARGNLAMFNFDESMTLDTINVPVLLIAAHLDRITIPESSVYMHEQIHSSELVVLKPAGHAGFLEQNEQFAKAVKTFSGFTNATSVELFAQRERDQRLEIVEGGVWNAD